MSNNYKHGDRIPSEVYTARLYELAQFVTDGPDAVRREFTMRIPAERDRDADLVLSGAARRITELEQRLKVLQDAFQLDDDSNGNAFVIWTPAFKAALYGEVESCEK